MPLKRTIPPLNKPLEQVVALKKPSFETGTFLTEARDPIKIFVLEGIIGQRINV